MEVYKKLYSQLLFNLNALRGRCDADVLMGLDQVFASLDRDLLDECVKRFSDEHDAIQVESSKLQEKKKRYTTLPYFSRI